MNEMELTEIDYETLREQSSLVNAPNARIIDFLSPHGWGICEYAGTKFCGGARDPIVFERCCSNGQNCAQHKRLKENLGKWK